MTQLYVWRQTDNSDAAVTLDHEGFDLPNRDQWARSRLIPLDDLERHVDDPAKAREELAVRGYARAHAPRNRAA